MSSVNITIYQNKLALLSLPLFFSAMFLEFSNLLEMLMFITIINIFLKYIYS